MTTRWMAGRKKVEREGRCRNCGSRAGLEAAHVIPRSLGGTYASDSFIPLCRRCHRAQHDGRLELLPLLTRDEQLEAVSIIGLGRAYRYLTQGN